MSRASLWPAEGSLLSCRALSFSGGLQASAGAAAELPDLSFSGGLRPQESEKIKATRYALDAFVAKTHRPSASGG